MYSSSIAGRKNLFVNKAYLDLMTKNIKSVAKDLKVANLAYLIMPNHFYWMFKLPADLDNPVAVYGEFKKRVSKEIMDNLYQEAKEGDYPLAELFAGNDKVKRSNAKRIIWFFREEAKKRQDGKKLKMWADDSFVNLVKDQNSLQKKLEILKNGPVKERWQLVAKAEDYPYLYLSPKPCM